MTDGDWTLIRAADSKAARLAALKAQLQKNIDALKAQASREAVGKADSSALADQAIAALVSKLEARAVKLGIRLREGAAQKLAVGLHGAKTTRGIDFTEDEVDALLRAQAEPEGEPAVPLSAAAKSVEELAEKACEALNPGDPRNQWATRTVAMQARRVMHSERLSASEAVAKVAKRLFLPGSPTSRATASLAKELAASGIGREQATVEAARATLALKSRELRDGAGVTKATASKAQVAEVLKAVRVAKGLSQEALARQIGLSLREVAYFEAGERVPNEENAFRLAKVLDLPPEVRNELGRLLREARSRAT